MSRLFITVSQGFNSPAYLKRKLAAFLEPGQVTSIVGLDAVDLPLHAALAESTIPITWLPELEASRPRLRNAVRESDKVVVFWDGHSRADLVFEAHVQRANIQIIPVEVARVANRDRGDPYDVYIGRKSPWGNPYPVGTGEGRYTREEAINLFRAHFENHILLDPDRRHSLLRLRGQVLGCHCRPLACHGDIIAAYLNGLDPDHITELLATHQGGQQTSALKKTDVADVYTAEGNRDVVFISHANPEDNQFTRWLALQLTREGYKVWTDLTDLLGGEDFWRDIEKVLRQRTAVFLYVLSVTSNQKEGPLNELAVARQIARSRGLDAFVVPLLLGNLDTSEINIELKRLNAVGFRNQWATGFAQLLATLSEQNIPKSLSGARALSTWWKRQHSSSHLVAQVGEDYYSNQFPTKLPTSIYVHRVSPASARLELSGDLPPWRQLGEHIWSFAPASDFRGHLPSPHHIAESRQVALDELLSGNSSIGQPARSKSGEHAWSKQQVKNVVIDLAQQGARQTFQSRGLRVHELSSRTVAFYFPTGLVSDDTVRTDALHTRRQVVGYRTVGLPDASRKIYWHFAVSGRLVFAPDPRWVFTSHVLFSDDGLSIWEDTARSHRARRRYCRNWWNDKWRDLLISVMTWLANDKPQVAVFVSSSTIIEIASNPLMFHSPVSYEPGEGATEPLDPEAEFDDADDLTALDDVDSPVT